jgi:hypothetical protein
METILSYFGIYEVILITLTCFTIVFGRWFLDPYFKHNQKKNTLGLEFYAGGEKLVKLNVPFLLRQVGEG